MNRPCCHGLVFVVGLSLLGHAVPAAAQRPDARYAAAIGPSLMFLSDEALSTRPLLTLRGEWRYSRDLTWFAEARYGPAGEWLPADCIVSECAVFLGGARSVGAWHAGVEIRGAEIGERHIVTVFVAGGQLVVREPAPPPGDPRVINVDGSFLVGVADRLTITQRLAVRASGALSLWSRAGADRGIAGVHEVPIVGVLLMYELGALR